MKKMLAIVILLLAPLSARAQSDLDDRCGAGESNPHPCFQRALELGTGSSYHRLSRKILELLAQPRTDPLYYFEIAELMKWDGNARAEYYYKKAIDTDPSEPAFELFFADYLRNYRGPLKPLFSRAEAHYFQALSKLERSKTDRRMGWDDETARRAERGLIELYQEEGVPLRGHAKLGNWVGSPRSPLLFVSSINRWAQPTGDFDNVDDIRAFTSEALLAAQRRVEASGGLPRSLFSGLSQADFRSIARVKPQYEHLDRVRFRYKEWPALEFYSRRREFEHAAITAFEFPGATNDVRVDSEYGAAAEKPFSLPGGSDFFMRGAYSKIDRVGLIEGQPGKHEIINQYEAQFSASKFAGPDKVIFQSAYVYQDINPKLDKQTDISKRDRQIASAKVTYDLLRKFTNAASHDKGTQSGKPGRPADRRFGLYGWSFFGGVAYDNERWGETILRKNDYFAGSEYKGLNAGLGNHPLDLSYQATVFTSEVTGNPFAASTAAGLSLGSGIEPGDLVRRQSIQLRHNAAILFRWKDEEREPLVPRETAGWFHPAFIHLVFPAKYD
ncbi:MAG TPA: hypothetical protein VJX67_21560, partial [Blastocatellia bacterium]|nr:hypothetical protein [Blastocatellia bacterium]